MRVAILPIVTFRNLRGESIVVNYTRLLKHWLERHDDFYAYMILPAELEDQGWEGDAWPRVTAVWEDHLGLYYDRMSEVPASFVEMFNPRNGRYQIDALITSRRVAAGLYARMLWDYRLDRPPPVFIDESMVAEFNKTPSVVSDIELIGQTLGYAFCWPLWDTEVQRKTAMEAARHYLSGSGVLKTMEKGVVIPAGFDPGRVDGVVGDVVTPVDDWDSS